MNLELLDPFRRLIPDRVDSTLSLPPALHKPHPKANPNAEWRSAYHLTFNRRGTYLAVGHASGTVAVHDFLSRTLSALYPHFTKEEAESGSAALNYPHGVTSVTLSRRSRSLLAGAVGDTKVRLIDTTHPFGPEECCFVAPSTINSDKLGDDDEDEKKPDRRGSMQSQVDKPYITLFKEPRNQVNFVRAPRLVETRALETSEKPQKGTPETEKGDQTLVRYPVVMFNLPEAVGGSLQIHPKDKTAGLAVLANGTLILFRAPSDIWNEYSELLQPVVKIVTLWEDDTVTSAAFSHVGDRIFLATKAGDLLGLDISYILYGLTTSAEELPKPKLIFKLQVGSMAWHLIVSRNGKHILLNCSDGALRLYSTQECIEGASWLKPKVFQDVVSKEPFVCCDFSGDGEYIVGGCNGVRDDKYELYLWSAATGALMDRLTGAPVSLYSVAWHPTRSFLAVATGDGLVDIWGPRMDWTAFAPDFQALPVNVEYVEEEDEFDFVENGEDKGSTKGDDTDDVVDVVTLEAVPVFASDSENEEEVFTFETKMNNLMFGRGRNRAEGKTGSDDKD